MSNTKHLIITERPGTVIEVITTNDRPAIIVTDGGSGRMAYFAPEKAPALALAILEAAGVEAIPFDEGPESEPGHAVWALRHHVQASEAKAKEAADREALETRRNEVANELLEGTISYKMCNLHFQRAIDRIIELEDRAKS